MFLEINTDAQRRRPQVVDDFEFKLDTEDETRTGAAFEGASTVTEWLESK